MPRGGARPGAGRKPKNPPAAACPPVTKNGVKDDPKWPFGHLEKPAAPPPAAEAEAVELMPLDYLLQLVRDETLDPRIRIQAATNAAPYVHAKKGEAKKTGGAKPSSGEAGNKYAARTGPRLVSSK